MKKSITSILILFTIVTFSQTLTSVTTNSVNSSGMIFSDHAMSGFRFYSASIYSGTIYSGITRISNGYSLISSTITPTSATDQYNLRSICYYNGKTYIGTKINTSNQCALFSLTGTTWSSNLTPSLKQIAISTTQNQNINAMRVFNNKLYFVGDKDLYCYDGFTITPVLGTNLASDAITDIEVIDSYLYVTGNFSQLNSQSFTNIVRLDFSNNITQVAPPQWAADNFSTGTVFSIFKTEENKIAFIGRFHSTTTNDSAYFDVDANLTNYKFYNISGASSIKKAIEINGLIFLSRYNDTRMIWTRSGTTKTAAIYNNNVEMFLRGDSMFILPKQNGATLTNVIVVKKISLAINTLNQPTCTGGIATAVKTVTNAIAPFNYVWKNNFNVVMSTTSTLTTSIAGKYKLTVTDFYGRVFTDSVIIAQPSPIAFSITKNDETICGTNDGSINVSSNYVGNYLWDSGQTTNNLTGLNANWYKFNFTSITGCTKRDSVQINCNIAAGITEIQNNKEIIVYPNPTEDYIYINNISDVIVSDILGNVIYEAKTDKVKLPETKGIYFIRINKLKYKIIKI